MTAEKHTKECEKAKKKWIEARKVKKRHFKAWEKWIKARKKCEVCNNEN